MSKALDAHMEQQVGFYTESDQPNKLWVHLGEILADRSIMDCQQTRAAIYGTLAYACKAQGIELILIRESGVPSIEDILSELNT